MPNNYFQILNAINVGEKVEKKNGLSYLSWAWAWAELKKIHPNATYTIYENKDGWNYHTDGRTAWVKTGVTVEGVEHVEYLPIMDLRNKSLPLEQVTSFNVNTAIQRSLTKAVARHGIGLYIYAGEDLPEAIDGEVRHEDFKANIKEELVRKTTLELLTIKLGELSPERLDKLNKFIAEKFGKKPYEQLKESEAKFLIAVIDKGNTNG